MSELWVITSYFNPAGWKRRQENYRHFRKHLNAPLLAVELTFGGASPVLRENDADILVHCSDGDVMWQKERLLNHALRHLPPTCRHVAWVDCDVVFGNDDWPQRASEALRETPLVQLFASLTHAPRDADPATLGSHPQGWTQPSLMQRLSESASAEEGLRYSIQRRPGSPSLGMAWAARRELLERHGLYDRCIVGGGDTALACAALGFPDIVMDLHHMNPAQRAAYRAWAEPLFADVQGRVSHLDQAAHHLWHGDMEDRQARHRHARLVDHDFDPAQDLAPGREGAWRWACHKPGLRAYVRDYFESRHEDGRPLAPQSLQA